MTIISSTFTTDTEGWTLTGDPRQVHWQASGGDPDGYLFWRDAVSIKKPSYWVAPDAYRGDLGEFYNGSMNFSWYASKQDWDRPADVIIKGSNGHSLLATVSSPTKAWSHVDLTLSVEGGWHLDKVKGPLATADQIQAILADVTGLQIRAEHYGGKERGGLDSVSLATAVEQGSENAASANFSNSHYHMHAETHPHLDTSHLALA